MCHRFDHNYIYSLLTTSFLNVARMKKKYSWNAHNIIVGTRLSHNNSTSETLHVRNIHVYCALGNIRVLGYSLQDYIIIKRLLRSMLKKNPEERASLSEILQDRELREALENPMGSHWSDML